MTTDIVRGQALFDHHLGGDASMIGSHLPKRLLARHAVVASQQIHDGVLKSMPHMQAARDIRRRNHNAIRLIRLFGCKSITVFPALIDRLFYLRRIVLIV